MAVILKGMYTMGLITMETNEQSLFMDSELVLWLKHQTQCVPRSLVP